MPTMRRRIFSILAASTILLFAFEQLFGIWDLVARLPQLGGTAINWFVELDYFLLNHGIHPFLLAVALVVLLSGWIIPDVWPLVRKLLFGKSRTAFSEDFKRNENQRARQDFIWNLHIAYRKFNQNATNNTLAEMLDKLQFPNDFPPQIGALKNYAYNPNWPNTASQDVWSFFVVLFSDVGTPNADDSALLDAEKYEKFLEGRRIASKFWDDWAREIEDGRLDYDEIKKPIFANFHSIQALVLSELALANQIPYDLGPGKTALFKLVMGQDHLTSPGMWRKLWTAIGGRLNVTR